MATSTVPLGKVEVCHRKQIPCHHEGWGVDAQGIPTTDASKILFGGGLLPLGGTEETGGYKGYGLSFMVEMLTGVLAGANFGVNVPHAINPNAVSRLDAANLGQSFIVIDPQMLGGGYDARLQHFVDDMHALPLAADAPGPVLVPGLMTRRSCFRDHD